MPHQLVITELSKTYPNGVQALKGVSLTIPTGMYGLLGPNGAGKSTLMRTLATLQEPDTGSIMLGQLNILKQKDEVRRVLGYLPQEFGVYPRSTAEELLDHFAVLKGFSHRSERRATVDALLHKTNLYDVRKQRLSTFSGGMKQRFGIAQALIGDPRLLIVDEPTAGLDPAERLRFHNLLSAIGENIIVILSTHIVEDVSDLCSRMAILLDGRVIFTDEPRAALASMEGRVWKKAIERHELADYEAKHAVICTRLFGGKTVVHILAEEPPDFSFEWVDADLEDVYFSVLRRAKPSPPPAAA